MDFLSTDSPHAPYGRKALNAALYHLHGFYRSSMMLWACQDWRDWESMANIYDAENQWPQVVGLADSPACAKSKAGYKLSAWNGPLASLSLGLKLFSIHRRISQTTSELINVLLPPQEVIA